jgi:hypothetical protein
MACYRDSFTFYHDTYQLFMPVVGTNVEYFVGERVTM